MWWLSLAVAAVPPEVADAARVGDCARVVTALAKPDGDDQRLLAGYCLVRAGRPADAAQVLGKVKSGVLGDYARFVRARAEVDLGRYDDAIATLADLRLPGPQGRDLRMLRAEALVRAKRSLDAREDLRALTNSDARDEARFWLAQGAVDRGDAAAAVPVLEALWAESVRGPWSEEAAKMLAGLGRTVPDVSSEVGRAVVEKRIASLRRANRHPEALALLDREREALPTAAGPLQLAKMRFAAKEYPKAVESFRAALGPPDTAQGSPSDLFDYALATARTGDHATAGRIYERLWTLHPTSSEADFASFKIGYMAYDRGEFANARAELAAHLERRPGSPRIGEALWFSARSAWRLGDRRSAIVDLDRLMSEAPRSDLVPAAAYWKARAKGLDGDAAAEKAGYEDVLRRWPVSGYAWFAAFRLGKTFEARAAVPRPAWPADLATDPAVLRAEPLLQIGLGSWASAELDPAIGKARATRDGALAMAHALVAAGEYQDAQQLARAYCRPPSEGGDPVAQQACVPRPEGSIVAAVAGKYGLDPLLPYGIMNAESSLDPTVTSIAGARGLMQLMPALGRDVHRELYGDTAYDPDNLYRPAYNASLGTAELGLRKRALGDLLVGTSVPAVVASYNGGEDAVRRWVSAWPRKPDFDEFAEDVGYPETRQYVRRVLGFEMQYRWVYGDP